MKLTIDVPEGTGFEMVLRTFATVNRMTLEEAAYHAAATFFVEVQDAAIALDAQLDMDLAADDGKDAS